jgi:hypothetical protein
MKQPEAETPLSDVERRTELAKFIEFKDRHSDAELAEMIRTGRAMLAVVTTDRAIARG